MKIDSTDLNILNLLKEDGKLSVREISKKIRKPITTVHNRVKKLQQAKIIKKYTIVPDYKLLGKNVYAYVLVSVEYKSDEGDYRNQEEVASEIRKLPEVEEVCLVTGVNDIVVRVRESDIDTLNEFLINRLRKISGVEKTQTMIVLKSI